MSNRDQDSKRSSQQKDQSDLSKSPQKQQSGGGFKGWSSNQNSN